MTALPSTTRRAVLTAIAASTVPVVAIPALASTGDDAELIRLHAELRPLALQYGKLGERWRDAEYAFEQWLAEQGMTIRKLPNVETLFKLRRIFGVEQKAEEHNKAGEAVDAITTAIAEIPATTAGGLSIKLDALLITIGVEPYCVFNNHMNTWPRECIDAFNGDVRAFVGTGRAGA